MTITILITNNANYLISPNIRHDTATVVAPVGQANFVKAFTIFGEDPYYEDNMLSYRHLNMESPPHRDAYLQC